MSPVFLSGFPSTYQTGPCSYLWEHWCVAESSAKPLSSGSSMGKNSQGDSIWNRTKASGHIVFTILSIETFQSDWECFVLITFVFGLHTSPCCRGALILEFPLETSEPIIKRLEGLAHHYSEMSVRAKERLPVYTCGSDGCVVHRAHWPLLSELKRISFSGAASHTSGHELSMNHLRHYLSWVGLKPALCFRSHTKTHEGLQWGGLFSNLEF